MMKSSLGRMGDKLVAAMLSAVGLARAGATAETMEAHGRYTFACYDKDGNLKWEDHYDNLVTTVGKNDILDKYFAGSGYTATHYMGLMSSVSYAAGAAAADTMGSHAGWTEAGPTNAPAYSQGTRPACTWATASAGAKALASAITFSITSAGTIKGSFICTNSAKDGTTGTLVSAGTFTGGDRPVLAGDTINASYSMSV